jgi:hypothetical protein
MVNEGHARWRDRTLRDILAKMRHDGCGGQDRAHGLTPRFSLGLSARSWEARVLGSTTSRTADQTLSLARFRADLASLASDPVGAWLSEDFPDHVLDIL